jgi:GTP cyclohydrolase II
MIKLAEGKLLTEYGEFVEHLFYDGRQEVIVLTKGEVNYAKNILVRVHSHCISAHIFNGVECDCKLQMSFSQKLIQNEELGIIIWLDQEGKGNGHLAKILSQKYKNEGFTQEESYKLCGFKEDNRYYDSANKVLSYFNINEIRLITNHKRKQELLISEGIKLVGIINTPKQNET